MVSLITRQWVSLAHCLSRAFIAKDDIVTTDVKMKPLVAALFLIGVTNAPCQVLQPSKPASRGRLARN